MIRPAGHNGSPKVLLVTRNFPPLRGGMERLNAHLLEALRTRNPSSALLGPAGSAQHVSRSTIAEELAAGPLPITLLSSMTKSVAMARRLRPDAVLAGSGLTAPAAVAAAKASGAVPMVYLHGLDIIAPSRIYRAAWLPCIRRCRQVLVNSANTRRLAIEAGVEPNRIHVVHPGTEIPVLDPHARVRFRLRHGIGEHAPVMLSVGRLTARKGIAEFVDQSLPAIRAVFPAAQLLIIGDEAPDALHRGRGAGMARVRALADARGVGDAIRWLGACSDAELGDAYQAADLHVFPVREIPGDVEGFGMVAIEAAAHGLPTIAFDVGGIPDAVTDGVNGRLVSAEDYREFSNAVIDALTKKNISDRERARQFSNDYSWERFGREAIAAIAEMG